MFRVKPRANLGLIFFTVLIQNSEKQWKVLSGCLKNLPSGIPSGHQTFPRGCAPRESLMTLGNSLGQIFPDNHCGLSTVYTKFPDCKIKKVTRNFRNTLAHLWADFQACSPRVKATWLKVFYKCSYPFEFINVF